MKKPYSKFTEESYNKKKEASQLMRSAGMTVKAITTVLNISDSSFYLMEKHDWEGYQDYLKTRREHEQKAAEQKLVQPEVNLVPESGQLDRIEAKLDLLLDKKGFTLLRR
jgi:hypothetical protein